MLCILSAAVGPTVGHCRTALLQATRQLEGGRHCCASLRRLSGKLLSSTLILSTLLAACAHEPTPFISPAIQASYGTVGVVAAQYPPEPSLDTPAKGALGGAGRKSVRWMGKSILGSLEGAEGCTGDSTGICAVLVIAVSVTASIIGGLTGAITGAVEGEPSDRVAFAEEVLETVIGAQQMQERLADRVAQVAECRTCRSVVRVHKVGPQSKVEAVSYASLAREDIDNVLELNIERVALTGDWDVNPPLTFQLDLRAALKRTSDDALLYEVNFQHNGRKMQFHDWAENNGAAFMEDLENAYEALAQKVQQNIFLNNELPESSVE